MTSRILTGVLLLAVAGTASAVDPKAMGKAPSVPKVPGTSSAIPGVPGIPGASGLSLPGIGTDTASNAAGVLQYCAKRKYLGGDAVSSVSSKLLGSKGLGTPAKAEKDPGYQSGIKGVLQGSDGSSFNFDSVPDKLKDQGCDQVLKNASSLI